MEYWSWVLTAFGIFGLWVAGSGKSWGWLIGLGIQVVWIWFAIATKQYGFIVSAIAYSIVYGRNYKKWKSKACQEAE